MVALLSSLDFGRYRPRRYFIGAGDTLSAGKIVALEENKTIVSSVWLLLHETRLAKTRKKEK